MSTMHASGIGLDPQTSPPITPVLAFHHIGVQAADLKASVEWYSSFFGARITWTLEDFSPLTLSRLPGITRLVEMVSGPLRFHLFARDGVAADPPGGGQTQYQHVCVAVDSSTRLGEWRERWFDAARCGQYDFTAQHEPTAIVVDDGVSSFYCLDPNGLEFEFTYVPEVAP
jgi:catechol 2,3-dioxygenase-like lactoylglutathione lyase family enzyme